MELVMENPKKTLEFLLTSLFNLISLEELLVQQIFDVYFMKHYKKKEI